MLKRLRTLFLLFLVCLITSVPAFAEVNNNTDAKVFFSSQLNANSKKIYDELTKSFTDGKMADGKAEIDLFNIVDQALVANYVEKGDRTLFNDFAAAKDAFDLQHPEAWYIDSSFLCLRTVKDGNGKYHALIGPGRGKTYYLDGQEFEKNEVIQKDAQLKEEIKKIVDEAKKISGNDDDAVANKVKTVHDKITRQISYRFENECNKDNSLYIRTTYGLVTHEGVCESYARSFQMCMNDLNIPCVIIMGMQTSGDSPEQHMWTAVKIGQVYYIVDPTWDDPIKVGSDGKPSLSSNNGVDGCEHTTYLLVGTDTTRNWIASGKVSAGQKEFEYPEISSGNYSGGTAFGNEDGLQVKYTSAAEVDGAPAGLFIITYKNKGIVKAGKEGYHLLIKMYDHHQDGTSHSLSNWYYVEAGLKIMNFNGKNPYFYDDGNCLKMYTAGCEYVEYALTTREPDEYKDWDKTPGQGNPLSDSDKNVGYYQGDGSDIFSETGKLYNVNSEYEAAPYVYRQYPSSTQQVNTGEYDAKVIFDDSLNLEKHPAVTPDKTKRPGQNGETTESGGSDPYAKYQRVSENTLRYYNQNVKIHYECTQLDVEGNNITHTLQGEVKFDSNRDGFVDPDKVTWLFECDKNHVHSWKTCRLVGVEFKFDSSPLWADDTTLYTFNITNIYGARSSKEPNSWGYLVSAPTCPFSYRSQGIDWNLWGRPSLLDNPDDINLEHLTYKGIDEESSQSLEKLQKSMNLERLNGRLTLVVEDLNNQREAVEEMEDTLAEKGINEDAIKKNSLYEINFNRMCRKTLSEIKDEDKMRIQVGFPPGFDANSNVVFKAYHFERDENGKITGVTEIPVLVTEYGLVVMCDSFSPFEMVALDPEKVPDKIADTEKIELAVVGDGNTKIYIDDLSTEVKDTSNLNVEFSSNQSHTFKFEPKDKDYQLEGIKLVGCEKTLDDQGQITLSYSDLKEALGPKASKNELGTILSVTSVPTSVINAEKQIGTPVQEKACAHSKIKTNGEAKNATCTETGLIPEKICETCGSVIEEKQVLPALGHDAKVEEDKKPSCTEEGKTNEARCRICNKVVQPASVIPPKGHTFDKKGYCTVCHQYDFNHDQEITSAREVLNLLIQELDGSIKNGSLKESDFKAETWQSFKSAFDKAKSENSKSSYSHGDASNLEAAYKNLIDAKDNLVADVKEVNIKEAEPTKEEAQLPNNIEPEKNVSYNILIKGGVDTAVTASGEKNTVHAGKKIITIGGYDDSKYSFIKWLVQSNSEVAGVQVVRALATNTNVVEYPSERIVVDVNANLTLKPVFVAKNNSTKITFKVNPENKATIKYKGEVFGTEDYPLNESFNVVRNSSLDLEAQPVSGFNQQFSGWTSSGGNTNFTNRNNQITSVSIGSSDTTLIANFEGSGNNPNPNPVYSVNSKASPEEGGKVSGGGYYNPGTQLTIYATPNEGYEFVNWTLNGQEVTKDSTLRLTVTTNALYIANFKKLEAKPEEPTNPETPTDQNTPDPIAPNTPQQNLVKVYRLYHDEHKEHLYTTDENEVRVLTVENGWRMEGTGWQAPSEGQPVYRLYSPVTCYHLYTTDLNEVRVLTTEAGWQQDFNGQPLFYSGGTVPVYRLYHSGQRVHHLTTDSNEYNVLGSAGWNQENVAFYAAQ